MSSQRNQTIALAAVCQSALFVSKIAKGEHIDGEALVPLYGALMITSPSSVFDVYKDIDDLRPGCELMLKLLSGKTDKKDIELTRYVAGVLALAKRLLQKPAALNELKQTIDQVERRLEHFGINDDSVIANFADAYSKAISPLGQKIQVLGNPDVLRQPNVQNKIRALLLAGVRAAVLWRQMGGKRRQFIFSRKNILQDAILFHKELTSN